VQDVWYFRRTPLAVDSISDGHLPHPKIFADERCQLRDRSAGCAGKDRAKCIGLLIVRALIDIRAQLPIAFPHWARRVDYERHVEAIEHHVVIRPILDVENQRYVAHALRWSRGERRSLGYEAWAHDAAIAVFKIIPREVPFSHLSLRHGFSGYSMSWNEVEHPVHKSTTSRWFEEDFKDPTSNGRSDEISPPHGHGGMFCPA